MRWLSRLAGWRCWRQHRRVVCHENEEASSLERLGGRGRTRDWFFWHAENFSDRRVEVRSGIEEFSGRGLGVSVELFR